MKILVWDKKVLFIWGLFERGQFRKGTITTGSNFLDFYVNVHLTVCGVTLETVSFLSSTFGGHSPDCPYGHPIGTRRHLHDCLH